MDKLDILCLFFTLFLLFLVLACYGSMHVNIPDEEEGHD